MDYVRVTGCRGDGYNSALQRAVNFLVFAGDGAPDDELIGSNDHDIGYVRRHSRHFFGPLFGDFQAGANDDYSHCLHPTLDRIGRELGFPESELNNSSDAKKTLPVRSENPEPHVTVFEVLSRADYMKSTECLASPKTYHKYHLAFFHGVLGWGDLSDATTHMREFLQELGEGRWINEGTILDPLCLHPAIKVLADDLHLLNEDGQFVLR